MQRESKSQTKFIRIPEVLERTGLRHSTLYELIAKGLFPSQVSLGDTRAVAFVEQEVDEWIAQRLAERGKQ